LLVAPLLLAGLAPALLQAAEDAKPQAQPAIVVRNPAVSFGGGAAIVAQEVDPADATQRLLLLTPGGPLVVQVEMTIDGQPFQTDRERMVDEALALADPDKDGKATWEEALKNPRFFGGRMAMYIRDEKSREQFHKTADKNADGLVDRYEARALIATYTGGPAFSMYNNPASAGGPDIVALLDADNNGVVSAEELAGAAERLASRDRDDNEIVDMVELGASPYGYRPVGGNVAQPKPLLGLIGKSLNVDEAYVALVARYGKEEKLPAMHVNGVPLLSRQLDQNENGLIDKEEISRLNEIEPHLQLAIHVGETGEKPAGLTLVALSEALGKREEIVQPIDGGVALSLSGVKLEFVSNNVTYNNLNYGNTAKAMINQYDADKNGYLELKEFPEAQQQYFKQQFTVWDADENGQVFAEEITKAYEVQARPQNYRMSVAGADMGASLFSVLDETGDNRLSLRETRSAAARLAQFDKDGDGAISAAEVPSTVRVGIARGAYAYSLVAARGQAAWGQGGFGVVRAQRGEPAKKDPLEWFTRMDRNGDGDVTLKEFPGDEEQFKALDTNGDGFIERKEAEAAK
jgi:Ca2+-binding EF-hand superfamily protein